MQQYQQDLKWDSAGRLREVQDRPVGAGTAVALSARDTADGEHIEKADPFTVTKVSSFGLFDTKTIRGTAEGTLHTLGVSFRKSPDVNGGTVGTAGQDRFFHSDQLGSTRHLTDGTGTGTHSTTPSRMRFDAYGVPTQLDGADGWDATEYQYAGAWGYEREPHGRRMGLDYLYQRYYDPAVGKFISADPIGIACGLNLYACCENDPVHWVDPSGLQAEFGFPATPEEVAGAARAGRTISDPARNKLLQGTIGGVLGFAACGPVGGAFGLGLGVGIAHWSQTNNVTGSLTAGAGATSTGSELIQLHQWALPGGQIPKAPGRFKGCTKHFVPRMECPGTPEVAVPPVFLRVVHARRRGAPGPDSAGQNSGVGGARVRRISFLLPARTRMS